MNTSRIPLTLAAAAASLALAVSPALAQGGSGGGGGSGSGSGGGGGGGGGGTTVPVSPPAPTLDPWTLCPDYAATGEIRLADGSVTFANVVSDMACVVVRSQGGVLTLYSVAVAPGWTYTIKSGGGGSQNRVDVEFLNPATGAKHSILVEPGKTASR
jgi:hypothetical protein